ncbi:LysR family transcriptional regulator [Allokutzneria sp. A3M-2-11 16]|uniref:LysR family transcriptional regulator n=1 Tax=Allokutzneria sp. A3M-2-11 16 TaxID=2962043 RepID=UPI0020B765E2|nr:LysR family transcriptional regulator [Allokutzneria sp. A3M-2-11 16]MCP3804126.1 LysR family transcriptional regulator [Allokutzneria sp. A3M-2-11 16]
MTLRQMEYLLMVAEEGSFTRAADRLRVSQPALSQQIRSLERSMGGELLERLPGSVRLNPAGRAFAEHAAVAVRAEREARRAVRDVLSVTAGELEVATVLSIAVGVLPPSLTRWHHQHPDIPVRLREYRHKRLLEDAVLAGSGDIAVGPRPQSWPGPIVDIGTERFVLVIAERDPALARIRPYRKGAPNAARQSRGRLALSALAEHSWITLDREYGLSEFVEEHLAKAGLSPRYVLRTAQVDAAARLAAAGVGVALLPANAIPTDLAGVVVEPDPPLTRDLAVYGRSAFTNIVSGYFDILQRTTTALDPPSR